MNELKATPETKECRKKFTAEEIAFLSTAFHGTVSLTFTQAINYSSVTPEKEKNIYLLRCFR